MDFSFFLKRGSLVDFLLCYRNNSKQVSMKVCLKIAPFKRERQYLHIKRQLSHLKMQLPEKHTIIGFVADSWHTVNVPVYIYADGLFDSTVCDTNIRKPYVCM